MQYFWINLGLHLLISLLLLIVFLWAIKRNRQHRWPKGFLFLLPTVLMILLLLQVVLFAVPRILDTTTVLRSTYRIESGKVEKIGILKHTIDVGGETYYVNPFEFNIKEGSDVIIKYTPYARYAYSIEPKADVEDSAPEA